MFTGDFSLSQTGVICKYLGKKYGLYPTSEEDEWHAEQLNTTMHDYVGEGITGRVGRVCVCVCVCVLSLIHI